MQCFIVTQPEGSQGGLWGGWRQGLCGLPATGRGQGWAGKYKNVAGNPPGDFLRRPQDLPAWLPRQMGSLLLDTLALTSSQRTNSELLPAKASAGYGCWGWGLGGQGGCGEEGKLVVFPGSLSPRLEAWDGGLWKQRKWTCEELLDIQK